MNETPPKYDFTEESWTELNEWAYCNDPLWHQVGRSLQRSGKTHDERLKMLAYALLCQNREQYQKLIDIAMNSPMPPIIIQQEPTTSP